MHLKSYYKNRSRTVIGAFPMKLYHLCLKFLFIQKNIFLIEKQTVHTYICRDICAFVRKRKSVKFLILKMTKN